MRTLAIQLAVVAMWCVLAAGQAQYKVLYTFGANGENDGIEPNGGLVFDSRGALYGSTVSGGATGAGTVFELSRSQDGTWQESILYDFCPDGISNGCPDGRTPNGGLIMDQSGNLYGTTSNGGANEFYGTVFELSPPKLPGENWAEKVLWSFGASNDGELPNAGVVFDSAGNLYGTTSSGPPGGLGTVFELSPGQNGWTETLLHVFCLNYPDCSDGTEPMAGVTFDKAGNLYGTTMFGGGQPRHVGWGLVYELSPTQNGWTETVLKAFTNGTGGRTKVGITIDPAGHLYGAVTQGPPGHQCGGVFRLNTFVGFFLEGGCLLQANLLYNSGALYGMAEEGGRNSQGVAFKLIQDGGKVSETGLYDFCQQPNCADGRTPNGTPVLRNGQLYGATYYGGVNNGGVIFQITP